MSFRTAVALLPKQRVIELLRTDEGARARDGAFHRVGAVERGSWWYQIFLRSQILKDALAWPSGSLILGLPFSNGWPIRYERIAYDVVCQ